MVKLVRLRRRCIDGVRAPMRLLLLRLHPHLILLTKSVLPVNELDTEFLLYPILIILFVKFLYRTVSSRSSCSFSLTDFCHVMCYSRVSMSFPFAHCFMALDIILIYGLIFRLTLQQLIGRITHGASGAQVGDSSQ
jgi:hypothetical protein